jgi:hypothetical protein
MFVIFAPFVNALQAIFFGVQTYLALCLGLVPCDTHGIGLQLNCHPPLCLFIFSLANWYAPLQPFHHPRRNVGMVFCGRYAIGFGYECIDVLGISLNFNY